MKRQLPGVFSGSGDVSQIAERELPQSGAGIVYFSYGHAISSYIPHTPLKEVETDGWVSCLTQGGGRLYYGLRTDQHRKYKAMVYDPGTRETEEIESVDRDFTCAIELDGVVYFGSEDHELQSYNPKTGEWKWVHTAKTGGWINSIIGIDGILYFNRLSFYSGDRRLSTYNPKTKEQHDVAKAKGDIHHIIPINGLLYYSSYGKIYSCNPKTGKQKKVRKAKALINCMAALDGVLYYGCADSSLRSFNPKTRFGKNKRLAKLPSIFWVSAFDGRKNKHCDQIACMAVADKTLYFGGMEGKLYSYNPETGKLNVVAQVDKKIEHMIANGGC